MLEEDALHELNYLNIISGKFLDNYENCFDKSSRVDYKLLENIESARNILIDDCKLKPEIVNSLIGRLLFVRYLIDRKVNIGSYSKLSNSGFIKILKDRDATYGLFNYLKEKFNGNMFPIDEKSESSVDKKALEVLIQLLKGHQLKDGQMSLFEFYDFSVIPIEFISNVYEFFWAKKLKKAVWLIILLLS